MSANTGSAPVYTIEFPLAMNVNGVVITSSPSPMPHASNAVCKAAVPEFTAIPYSAPTHSANFSSNSATFGP